MPRPRLGKPKPTFLRLTPKSLSCPSGHFRVTIFGVGCHLSGQTVWGPVVLDTQK